MTPTSYSWREEARQDRLVRAQIEREQESARVQARIAEREAAARVRREAAQARQEARALARADRSARRAALAAWLATHVIDLLFVPVVVVPAALAWTAMSAYGYLLYGPAGLALPAFSEGAMWAFAAATTFTRRRDPDKPVWHLRAGTVVFAAVGAALNFAHGMTAAAPQHGPVTGAVYAVVSIAGVSVHQLVTAGPRRSPAERGHARISRAIARRELAARRAAVRTALVDLDEDGNARLVFEPSVATLGRRHGRTRLAAPQFVDEDQADDETASAAEQPEETPDTAPPPPAPDVRTPEPDTDAAVSADMSAPAPDITPDIEPDITPSPKRTPKRTSRRTPKRTPRGHVRLTNADARTRAAKALKDTPDMSMTELAALIGRSERQARRIKNELAEANGHQVPGGEALTPIG